MDVADFFAQRVISLGAKITVPAEVVSLAQFFGSRALLLPLDRPLKINVEGRSTGEMFSTQGVTASYVLVRRSSIQTIAIRQHIHLMHI